MLSNWNSEVDTLEMLVSIVGNHTVMQLSARKKSLQTFVQ